MSHCQSYHGVDQTPTLRGGCPSAAKRACFDFHFVPEATGRHVVEAVQWMSSLKAEWSYRTMDVLWELDIQFKENEN